MNKLMMIIIAVAILAFSSNASANEPAPVPHAISFVDSATATSLEVSVRHASKLENRHERKGKPDLAVNKQGQITNFGRVIESEELYVMLGRPDLVLEIAERERENQIGNVLITAGVVGQTVSAFWMTAELLNLFVSFTYPAGAGWGRDAQLTAPAVLGVTSMGVMVGGFVLRNENVDPLTQDEKIQLFESQLGLTTTSAPEAQMTFIF